MSQEHTATPSAIETANTAPRVRFAPSPTGHFHLGSARTALFNYLFAKKHGGTFILRIEDTDKARSTDKHTKGIYSALRWMELQWDEGPFEYNPHRDEHDDGLTYKDIGNCGPYMQSQRSGVYAKYLEQLKTSGHVYEKDGAWWFKLKGERYTEYDDYAKADVEKVKAAPTTFTDLVRGTVTRAEERDFVLVRADGSPGFHFTNVVDDIEMNITHVIRGEDHLSNTTKHVLLYQALGAPVPIFAHLPLILKSEGQGKMSKRDEGALIEHYESRYLPMAVCNFMALLGWAPGNDQEVYLSLAELADAFDFSGVQKAGARFDEKKMAHINTEHIRALPIEQFEVRCAPHLPKEWQTLNDERAALRSFKTAILKLVQPKVVDFGSITEFCAPFFAPDDAVVLEPAAQERIFKKATAEALLPKLILVQGVLEGLPEANFNAEDIKTQLEALATTQGEKIFAYFPILRFSTTGQAGGPDLLPLIAVLGKTRTLNRIAHFLQTFKG